MGKKRNYVSVKIKRPQIQQLTPATPRHVTSSPPASISTNLLLLGGAAGAVGSYFLYQYFNNDQPSENFAPPSDLITINANNTHLNHHLTSPLETVALTLMSAVGLLFGSLRDRNLRVSLAVPTFFQMAAMIPIVSARNIFDEHKQALFNRMIDEGLAGIPANEAVKIAAEIAGMPHTRKESKLEQNFRHFKEDRKQDWKHLQNKAEQSYEHAKAKVKQGYEHQKNYETLADWRDAANRKIERAVPPEIRNFLSGVHVSGNTNGETTTVTTGFEGGPQTVLYSSEEPKSIPEHGNTFISEFPSDKYAQQAQNAEAKELIQKAEGEAAADRLEKIKEIAKDVSVDAGKESLKTIDKAVPGLGSHLARNVGVVEDVFKFGKRATDERFENENPVTKLSCAAWACTIETTAETLTGGPVGDILLPGFTNQVGDHAQQNCLDVVNMCLPETPKNKK